MKRELASWIMRYCPHLARTLYWGRSIPRKIVIEPTNRCDIACWACLRSKMSRPIGDLSFEDFKDILKAIPSLERISLFFMGEPFLNDDLLRMVDFAEIGEGIRTHIATNSTLLRGRSDEILSSGLSSIALSLDGMSQETINQYRVGCDFSETIEGITELCSENWKRGPNLDITIRFLVFSHNEHEIADVVAYGRQMRVRLHLVRPILDWGFDRVPKSRKRFMSSIREFQRYNADGTPRGGSQVCDIFNPLITWDGRVLPCCYDTDARHEVGNIFEQDFDSMYWGDRFTQTRKAMIAKTLDICSACKRVENPFYEVDFR